MNIENKFAANQKDLMLDDSKVIWCGESVVLYNIGLSKVLASFSANTMVLPKLMAWCVKNNYRCSAVHSGRVWL